MTKAKVTISKTDLKVVREQQKVKSDKAQYSLYFVRKDRSDILYNNLSQVLKHLENNNSDFCKELVKLNDNKKLTINDFYAVLEVIRKKITF